MSRFFFSGPVIGAVCGLVGGLIDSAHSHPTATAATPHNAILEICIVPLPGATLLLPIRDRRERRQSHYSSRYPCRRVSADSIMAGGARNPGRVNKSVKFASKLGFPLDNEHPALIYPVPKGGLGLMRYLALLTCSLFLTCAAVFAQTA